MPALGNFASEFATSLRDSSFHVAVLAHNDSTAKLPSLWQWPALRPIAMVASTSEATYIDLTPLRPLLSAGRLGVVSADLRRLILQMDAVVVLGGAHDSRETAY